jgi:hypothetical protein
MLRIGRPVFCRDTNAVIVDSNGNLERVTSIVGTGQSAGSAPAWATTFGATTTSAHNGSNSATFTNQGPSGIIGSAYTGGTSAIVIDNIGSASGASNIYFSTLGSQTCVTSGSTGGCAIQASQSAP